MSDVASDRLPPVGSVEVAFPDGVVVTLSEELAAELIEQRVDLTRVARDAVTVGRATTRRAAPADDETLRKIDQLSEELRSLTGLDNSV